MMGRFGGLPGPAVVGVAAGAAFLAPTPLEGGGVAEPPVRLPVEFSYEPARNPASAHAACPRSGAGPEYYRFPLVSTGRVPGTGRATGAGEVSFSPSPYGIALAEDGSYLYDFTIRFQRLNRPPGGAYVVWTATPTLDRIVLSGELTDPWSFTGQVSWNKFLLVVTLEPTFDPDAVAWSGPVVIRGMSRSGMMHTMAGHGPFEEENCAAYGYE